MYISNAIPLPGFPSKIPPFHAPPPASTRVLPHYPTSTPLHWGIKSSHRTRASLPIDAIQCRPLLHTQLEPRIPPCVYFGWWFSSLGALGGLVG